MRKLILFLALLLVFSNAMAQSVENDIWPGGFTLTDINGNTYAIDAILDSGKSVIIDAFADWCGPCWGYSQTGTLENLNDNMGPAGADKVRIFGVEADPQTPASDISNASTGQGDWTTLANYPLANNNLIAGILHMTHYPTIVIICPDRKVTELDQGTLSQWTSAINSCGSAAPTNHNNDPRLIANKTFPEYCTGKKVTFKVVMQNYSHSTITNATLKIFNNGTAIKTKDWTGVLNPYAQEEVAIAGVTVTNPNNVHVEITSPNDDTSNDDIAVSISPATQLQVNAAYPKIILNVQFDNWAADFGVVFNENTPFSLNSSVVYSNAVNGNFTPLYFKPAGTYSNGDTGFIDTLSIAHAGCYYFDFYDDYSDGMVSPSPGAIQITGYNNTSATIDPNYKAGVIKLYNISMASNAGILENHAHTKDIHVYPNPFSNKTSVDFNVKGNQETTISVYNTLGEEVESHPLGIVSGHQHYVLKSENLSPGLYILRLSIGNNSTTKKISLTK